MNDEEASQTDRASSIDNDATSVWVCRYRPDGPILYANDLVCRLAARSHDELVGSDFFDLFLAGDRLVIRRSCAALRVDSPMVETEHRHVDQDGRERWLRWNHVGIFRDDGELIECQALGRDVTDSRRELESLRRSQDLFAAMFRMSPAATILSHAADGRCVDANNAYCRLTGYRHEELVGRTTLELGIWYDEAERRRVVRELALRGRLADVEIVIRTKQGEIRHTIASGEIVTLAGTPYILSFFFDITDKRKTDEMLANAQKLESLGILAGGIAHDFNNLLTGIFGFISLAQTRTADPRVSELLLEAFLGLNRARGLTQQLLTFAKGGVPMRKLTSVSDLLRKTVEFALSGSNIGCKLRIDDGLWFCEVDESQIAQALDNIVINARQAMHKGGAIQIDAANVTLPAEGSPEFTRGDFVRIAIADTGPGIPPENLGKVFDPFFTTRPHGSGLGLATAYSIVTKHGGHIGVESQPGQGATFVLFLPASPGKTQQPAEPAPNARARTGRILVMDDEGYVRSTIVLMLRTLGYDVESVASGREAVDVLVGAVQSQSPFDAVILDLTIRGGRGGKEVVIDLIAIDPNTKAIAVSGYADDAVLTDPGRFSFRAALRKPFAIHELAQTLDSVLSEGTARSEPGDTKG